MSLIIIIATIWGISALISHTKQARLAKEQMRQREAQARLLREQRAQAQRQREMEKEQKQLALQARQERVARERMEREQAAAWEKQRKEDAARDAKIAKHDEEIRKLNQTISRLSEKVEDIENRIINLEAVKEMNYKKFLEADHAGDDTNKEKYLRKLIALDNQLSAARDSRQAMLDKIENAKCEMAS